MTQESKYLCKFHARFICRPTFQHQQQVMSAIERAKQVTMQDLNQIVGVSSLVPNFSLMLEHFASFHSDESSLQVFAFHYGLCANMTAHPPYKDFF